ncbi:MAG: S8 family serine peptidase [Candidatus Krumholzibacteria bacterium]|jgi:subtilisin family serine protease|nr:S8 family serine peptidase [Candidatus Krumholzibacteria bacterium]MDP7021824.1 S8 family serine peptidase [Candidatus Krumholzibacteria bacterium]
MTFARSFFTPILLLALLMVPALAGEFHPGLQLQLDATAADETLSVIVMMEEQAPIAEMNEQLKRERATMARRHREVIIALQDASSSQRSLLQWLDSPDRSGEILGYTSYWIANLLVIEGSPDAIREIASRPDVSWVEANFTVNLIDPVSVVPVEPGMESDQPHRGTPPGIEACRVPEVWYNLGITGEGALIASLDTGVDGNHPALSSRYRGTHAPASECWLDVIGAGGAFPSDGYGHGTHTVGTMCGAAADTVGCAPDAEWIACNAIDQGVGSAFDNDVIAAFQWFADPDGDPGTTDDVPDVVQNSWGINEGFGGGYQDCDSRWWAAIDAAEAAGVVSVWSAGNEGPSGTSLRSPADRASTEFSSFSVGAVDATNDNTFPYNMASFSSRGPTGCNVTPDLKIKPEIVGPGVDVYSTYPGGGYTYMSGTSMSGPHLSGVVALMRSANPNLDVDTVKLILMQTARDQNSAGEDNTSGWGMVDAYEAVLNSMSGFGEIEGYVTNESWGDVPLPGAIVQLEETTFAWLTDDAGFYSGMAGADTYIARASLNGFSDESRMVTLESGEVSVVDFDLQDNAGPAISNVTQVGFTNDTSGPYTVSASAMDYSTVSSVSLFYRVNHGSWTEVIMSGAGTYSAEIPGAAIYSQVDYYIQAEDGLGLLSVDPPAAPVEHHSFYITNTLLSDDLEAGAGSWSVSSDGSLSSGEWEWADPNGTTYNGAPMAPSDDHTPAPGIYCFVTDNGSAGGAPGDNDVDGGCTTLYSPLLSLSEYSMAFASYWRWYAEDGFSTDDEWAVDLTGDGVNWQRVDTETGNANSWNRVMVDISSYLDPLTDQVQFRFVACDLNNGGLVEGGVDDFAIEVLMENLTAAPGENNWQQPLNLLQSQPNPFRPSEGPASLRFSLAQSGPAELQIFDLSGRLVRTLSRGQFVSGEHQLFWDGRDSRGHSVSSGVYFYRLESAGKVDQKSLVLLR